jgi:type I restriction enzyme M protein
MAGHEESDDLKFIVNLIWTVADQALRGPFKPREYEDVILPMTVLRRIDCTIRDTQQQVRARHAELKDRIQNLDPILRKESGFPFYNTSRFDFKRLLEDPENIVDNVNAYINGFSPNMVEVLENFEFRSTLLRLAKNNRTFLVFQRFAEVNLHPNQLSNHGMGYVFEELIRKFNEENNESPGEHYTPREIVNLMTRLMVEPDANRLGTSGLILQVLDPCCGTGGMLSICKKSIESINESAIVQISGQELNPKTYAISKSDMMISTDDSADSDRIQLGNTLSNDQFSGETYHYMLANPPYGVDWSASHADVTAEHELGDQGRFAPGLPRKSDGQTLFMLHMLAKMKSVKNGGSRVAVIMNGSPLFTGDANSGESEIRRYVLENDLLEAIVAFPEQIFYNTGISTYAWILSNRKEDRRKGKVQLIDASSEEFWKPMRKSLGNKRREMTDKHIESVMAIYDAFEHDTTVSKVYPCEFFGYRKITVDRPLKLNFQTTEERIQRLLQEKNFQKLDEDEQQAIFKMLTGIKGDLHTDRAAFVPILDAALKQASLKLKAPLKKSVLKVLSERDSGAKVCLNKKGEAEHDGDLRDTERIPMDVPIEAYMEKEVWPHVPDAWVNESVTDMRTGEVGKVGYEINFNRYFYIYTPPRPLEVIESEILDLQKEINDLMGKLFE